MISAGIAIAIVLLGGALYIFPKKERIHFGYMAYALALSAALYIILTSTLIALAVEKATLFHTVDRLVHYFLFILLILFPMCAHMCKVRSPRIILLSSVTVISAFLAFGELLFAPFTATNWNHAAEIVHICFLGVMLFASGHLWYAAYRQRTKLESKESIWYPALLTFYTVIKLIYTTAYYKALLSIHWYIGCNWFSLTLLVIGYLAVTRQYKITHFFHPENIAESILHTMADIVLVIDPACKIKYANNAALNLLGYEMRELLGQSIELVFGNDSNRMKEINDIVLNDYINNEKTIIQTKSGAAINVLMSTARLSAPLNNQGTVCIFKNVTDIVKAQEEIFKTEERLRTLTANIPEVVYRVDNLVNWSFIYVNKNIFTLTGYTPDEFLGKTIAYKEIILHEDSAMVQQTLSEAVITQRGYDLDYRIVHKDGTIKWVHNRGEGIFNKKGEMISYDGIISDITNRKVIEKELTKLNGMLSAQKEELQYLIHIRSLEFQSAIGKLVKSEEKSTISTIVACLAHELNTPIGMCITSLSFLAENGKEFHNAFLENRIKKSDFVDFMEIFDESMSILHGNLNQAIQLLRSFKQISADRANDTKRNINLKGYIEEILVTLRPRLKSSGHRIVLEVEPALFIYTNPGALSEIFTNLIMNSLLHGFENMKHGTITITSEEKEGMVCIVYQDNGCGIPKENLDKVFELYYTTKKNRGGTGLGMSIVKDLIERSLNGSIRLESDPGHFTKFYIEFPKESGNTDEH